MLSQAKKYNFGWSCYFKQYLFHKCVKITPYQVKYSICISSIDLLGLLAFVRSTYMLCDHIRVLYIETIIHVLEHSKDKSLFYQQMASAY